jgi:hypothetical protein
VTISDSTLYGNFGGIYNAFCDVTVINSTLSANGFPDDTTGFDAQVIGDVNSSTTLVFTTIAGSAGIATPGLFALDPSAAFTLKNSLLAGHSGGNCAASGITSDDYNLSDDTTCSFDGVHDINDAPAGLDPAGLAANAGPTPTIALLPDSPAWNAIPEASCTDDQDTPVTSDQRGVARPQGTGCDIGAFELSDRIFADSFE